MYRVLKINAISDWVHKTNFIERLTRKMRCLDKRNYRR